MNVFSGFFNFFPIIFFVIFALIISVFLIIIVNGIKKRNRNITLPTLTVEATVVSRRAYVSSNSFTRYYVTFQVPSGDRIELETDGEDYGMLAEGDAGRLTFQGTRYKGFDRI